MGLELRNEILMRMNLLKRSILICSLWMLAVSTPKPAQGGFSDDISLSHDVSFGVLVGMFSLAIPKYTGTLIALMALENGQTSFLLIGLPLSYYDHAVIPKELATATTRQERQAVKTKNFLITAFAGTMMMWSKKARKSQEENPEVLTQQDSQFYITPYEDTWALNYHLRF